MQGNALGAEDARQQGKDALRDLVQVLRGGDGQREIVQHGQAAQVLGHGGEGDDDLQHRRDLRGEVVQRERLFLGKGFLPPERERADHALSDDERETGPGLRPAARGLARDAFPIRLTRVHPHWLQGLGDAPPKRILFDGHRSANGLRAVPLRQHIQHVRAADGQPAALRLATRREHPQHAAQDARLVIGRFGLQVGQEQFRLQQRHAILPIGVGAQGGNHLPNTLKTGFHLFRADEDDGKSVRNGINVQKGFFQPGDFGHGTRARPACGQRAAQPRVHAGTGEMLQQRLAVETLRCNVSTLVRGAQLPASALALGQRGPVRAGDLAGFLEEIEVGGHGDIIRWKVGR